MSEVTHDQRMIFVAGLNAFAWWKDGTQFVGTCGTTFKEAAEQAAQGEFDYLIDTALAISKLGRKREERT